MSSPCQDVAIGDEEELTTFFRHYDELQHKAQSLAVDGAALKNTQKLHTTLASRLQQAKQAVQTNIDFRKEQTDRIALVTSHWFYGNTVYQPQLWFRGGCAGKVARARAKLEAAEREVDRLNREALEAERDADLAMVRLVNCQAAFEASSSAESSRLALKEEAVQKHPSAKLHHFIHELSSQRNLIEKLAGQEREIEAIARVLNSSQRDLQSALKGVEQSEAALQELQRLERDHLHRVPSGQAVAVVQGNSRTTNPRRPGSVHGTVVQSVTVSRDHHRSFTPDGTAVNALDNHDRKIRKHQQKANESFRKAQEYFKKASKAMEDAISTLIQFTSIHGCSAQPARLVVIGLTENREPCGRSDIQEFRSQITRMQTIHKEHQQMVAQLQTDLKSECSMAQQTYQQLEVDCEAEKNRIFETLRAQAKSAPKPRPSAPSSEADVRDTSPCDIPRSNFRQDSSSNATEPPILIPTERITGTTDIRVVASVVPLAPPQVLDECNASSNSVRGLEPMEWSQRSFVEADIAKS